jgi:hypothetical protein
MKAFSSLAHLPLHSLRGQMLVVIAVAGKYTINIFTDLFLQILHYVIAVLQKIHRFTGNFN